MSFGQNLQFLRKMHRGMTQEELAEMLGVSRQTISKWEMDAAFPEMEKALNICRLFACSLDDLLLNNLNSDNEAFLNIRVEDVPGFRYYRYAVISSEPEGDAQRHVEEWAKEKGIKEPQLIGWDFPILSQEQINVYHMHGYAAACILPEGVLPKCKGILTQAVQKYAVITIKNPFLSPFTLIPSAYKTLMRYMEVNHLKHREEKTIISCFEKVYEKEGTTFMDVYIAIEP